MEKVSQALLINPQKIIFLTCDAYGVLPPVAKLDPAQGNVSFY